MPEATPAVQRRPQIPALTSLRFFAALAIVVLHATNHGLLPAAWAERVDLSKAVSFFFVLSGFVLSYAYRGRRYSARRFYQARWARVWPAAAVSILLVPLVLPPGLFLPQPGGGWATGPVLLLSLLGLQSLVPIPEVYFGLNAVTWSISTEAGFYVLFPWLQRWVQLRPGGVALLVLLLGLAIGVLALQLPGYGPSTLAQAVWQGLVYVNPLARLGEFLAGLLAAEWFLSRHTQAWLARSRQERLGEWRWLGTGWECLGLAAPLVVPWLLEAGHVIRSLAPLIPMQVLLLQWVYGLCFALAIAVIAMQLGMISQLLNWAPLVFLGEISYSLYLYHQLVMIRLVQAPQLVIGNWTVPRPNFFVVFLTSLCAAALSWFWVERPCLAVLRPASN